MSAPHRSRREQIAFRLPVAVVEFPFETFAGVAALLIGATILLDLTRPTSLVRLLPDAAVNAWASGLVVAGMATLAAIIRRRPLPYLLAAGLRLFGALVLIYGAAIVFVGGFERALISATFYFLVGGLSMFRAFHLRTLAEVRKRIREEL